MLKQHYVESSTVALDDAVVSTYLELVHADRSTSAAAVMPLRSQLCVQFFRRKTNLARENRLKENRSDEAYMSSSCLLSARAVDQLQASELNSLDTMAKLGW